MANILHIHDICMAYRGISFHTRRSKTFHTIPSSQPLAVTVKQCRRDTLPVQLTMSLAYPTPGIPADAKCSECSGKNQKKLSESKTPVPPCPL